MDINTDSGCSRTMDLNTVCGNIACLDLIIAIDGSGWHDHSGGLEIKLYHVPKWWPSPRSLTLPSMVAGVMDISADSGCSRTMKSNMNLRSSLGPVITINSGGSAGYPNLKGLGSNTTLKHKHGLSFRPIPWKIAWTSMTNGVTGINKKPSWLQGH